MIAGLPYDAEVEYLESTGTQWINMDVLLGSSDVVSLVGIPKNANSFFGFGGDVKSRFNLTGSTGLCRFYFGPGGAGQKDVPITLNERHSYVCGRTFSIDGEVKEIFIVADFTGVDTSYMFARKASGANDFLVGAIYWLKIERNGVLVRDFIPVRFTNELGQSEGAMYDRVSRKLFRNQGTGSFVTGPDVAVPVMGLHFMRRPRYTAKDYVQDGLVAMWDGIENAGWGQHNANATVFKELVSGNSALDMVLTNDVVVETDAMRCLGTTTRSMQVAVTQTMPTCRTVEIVLSNNAIVETYGADVFAGFGVQIGCGALNYRKSGFFELRPGGWSSPVYVPQSLAGHRFAASFSLTESATAWGAVGCIATAYLNGTSQPIYPYNVIGSGNDVAAYWYGRMPGIGGNASGNSNYNFNGYFCCVRCYSRVPTADEIAHNYAVDKERFNLP